MKNKIDIYGAKSLDRYTNLVLRDGFINNSWEVLLKSVDLNSRPDSDFVIYQIHGAPQAAEEDKIISKLIEKLGYKKIVVLVHRPDEVEISFPGFKNTLSKLSHHTALVFLGKKHINDSFYQCVDKKFVVPHGFFDIKDMLQTDPIVIGSHTTWGEMRSIKNALKLILEIFKLDENNSENIIGYLGGKPNEQLQIENLKNLCKSMSEIGKVEFIESDQYPNLKTHTNLKNSRIIFVNSKNIEPEDFGTTFNIQMYNLGNKIRTGESSGSIHASTGIPVILEMNGSEIIENLEVVRIPYSSLEDINSVDYLLGAQKIIDLIKTKKYIQMLRHNSVQIKKFNNTFVSKEYVKIFNQI